MVHVQVRSYVVLGLLHSLLVHAQDFSIPANWRKPNSTTPRTERITIAQAAVDSLVPAINASNGTVPPLNTWTSAILLASIAQLDYVSAAQTYHDVVKNSIAAFQSGHPQFFDSQVPRDVTNDPLMWGLAAFYSSRAYNDTDLLHVAEGVWNDVQPYVVTADDAAAGRQPSKNGTFNVNCIPNSNATSAGAVFWQSTIPTDYGTNVESVGAYALLSARLWESTGNVTYLDSADQSTLFVYTFLYANNLAIFYDTYDLELCQVPNPTTLRSFNQGYIMETLLILSTAPLKTNTTWSSLLHTLVSSTIPFPSWTADSGSNAGVMNETSYVSVEDNEVGFIYKDIFINALFEIWMRKNSSDPTMASYIQAFIMVQYNALLDLASGSERNVYSPVWTGPVVPQQVPWGQLEAMPVLNAAVAMPPTSNSTLASSSSSRILSAGAITGIVIGAVVGLAMASLGVFLALRRSRRANRASAINEAHTRSNETTMVTLTPFSATENGDPQLLTNLGSGATSEYSRKYRQGYGSLHTPPASAGANTEDMSSVPLQTDSSVAETTSPTELNETSLTRLIQQVLSRMHAQEAPPAYT